MLSACIFIFRFVMPVLLIMNFPFYINLTNCDGRLQLPDSLSVKLSAVGGGGVGLATGGNVNIIEENR